MSAARRSLPLVTLGLLFAACSHAPPPKATPAPDPAPANLSGVWDWILSSVDEENNKRVEQEEWHLNQAKGRVRGFYTRTVTVVSGDENLFRCNGQRTFEKRLRFRIEGQQIGKQIVLREVAVVSDPSPCGNIQAGFQTYIGRTEGGSLTLLWEGDPALGRQRGQQTLFRRPQAIALLDSDDEWQAKPAASVDLAGTWTWETRGLNPYGDTTIEQEQWHLEQAGAQVRGFYDRLVTTISTDGGAYACNHETQFATLTRYFIEGSISGNEVELREVAFDVKPSVCEEHPQRRLDVYQGNVNEGGEIVLHWGAGAQILRRTPSPVASTPVH